MICQGIVIPDCLGNLWLWLCRGSDVCSSVSSHFWLFRSPRTIAQQIPLFSIISQSLLKFMITESMMLSNHPIFCFHLLLLPWVLPSNRVFSRVGCVVFGDSLSYQGLLLTLASDGTMDITLSSHRYKNYSLGA